MNGLGGCTVNGSSGGSSGSTSGAGGGGGNSGIKNYSANLSIIVQVQTYDYYGKRRTEGGDPVHIGVIELSSTSANASTTVQQQQRQQLVNQLEVSDLNNGLYESKFTPMSAGQYRVEITVFGRHVNNNTPLLINCVDHMRSMWTFGGGASGDNAGADSTTTTTTTTTSSSSATSAAVSSPTSSTNLMLAAAFSKGSGDRDFNMPIGVRCVNNLIYVLDSGNSRLKLLTLAGHFVRHVRHEGLADSACTGLAVAPNARRLLTLNWRSKLLSTLELDDTSTPQPPPPPPPTTTATPIVRHHKLEHFDEPISVLETWHASIVLIQDRKRLHLCAAHDGSLLHDESLEKKMRLECGVKSVSAVCSRLDKARLFVADAANIYEMGLDWLCDYKLEKLVVDANDNHPQPTTTNKG